MKRLLILPLLAVILALPVTSTAIRAADHPGHDHGDEEEHTELGNHMEEIGGTWRKVRRGSRNPANDAANGKLVAGMIEHAKAGLELIPIRIEDIPESEHEAFLAEYRKEMERFIEMLTKLEKSFAAGEHEKAVGLVAEISKHQRASHKKFKRPDED